jgi:hypothetical protein
VKRLAAIAAALALGALALSADATQPALHVVRGGGAAGGDAVYLPGGDLLNVRNIQGGTLGDLNLDLGAGNSHQRGNVVVNYDVGSDLLVYDGHKHLVARIGRSGIVFYAKPRVRRPTAHRSCCP